jgi:purine-nucleoside phosphorylase
MSTYYDRVNDAAAWVRGKFGDVPDTAIVLGSGLGSFAEALTPSMAVAYDAIPHWAPSRVIGHAGRLVLGTAVGRRVLALSGRVHVYEGYDLDAITFGIRVLGRLGVRRLVLTSAAGGINPRFTRGALMVLDDHINFVGANPLVGPNEDRFGPRFPDMTVVYSERLRRIADDAARAIGLSLEHGTYIAVSGPSYETPSEVRAFRVLGADAVGMSMVPEALVARHMGLEVLGLSCITNMAAGLAAGPLSQEEVIETASRVRAEFVALLEGILSRL